MTRIAAGTLTGPQHRLWCEVFDHLRAFHASLATSAERAKRRDFVTVQDPRGYDTTEIAWLVHERSAMHTEINRLRATRGLGPADAAEVADAESRAAGHYDYAHKFALYCADLVTHDDPRLAPTH
ncbi:hypothetical protein [Nocardioides sp. Leaf285]|uniref:hypothetical protein n=1 Tax=Nocardioides sp. Leaf285 TaxID=1736322 RepID=UPI000702B25E|nr:hypothetical protein [Nocardioides sp. Leaf285]KQP62928.1 hypothetical protein ASF47_18115 [Nocardioides sp. Leaf285]